jgi:hypothetical protein
MIKTAPLLMLGGLLLAHPALAGLPEVQRRIDALEREIGTERRMLETEAARKAAGEKSALARLADMREQTRRARREADSLKQVLAAQARPGQNQADEQKRLKAWNDRFAHALADRVDAVLAKLEREELPHYAEPKQRALKDLSRGLRTGVIPPDQGLGQAFDHLSEIIGWASKVEAVAGSYTTLAGAPANGFFVRVGGAFEGFVTEDGKLGAYRMKGMKDSEGWQWKESLTAERRDNLLRIARMTTAGEQPGFVPVPFGLVSGGAQ